MERIIEQLSTVCGRNKFFAVLNVVIAIALAVVFYVQLMLALIISKLSFFQLLNSLLIYYSIPGVIQLFFSYLIYKLCNDKLAILAFVAPIIASVLNLFVTQPAIFVSEVYFVVINFIYTAVYGWRRLLFLVYVILFIVLLPVSFFSPIEKIFYILSILFILIFSAISGISINTFIRVLEIDQYLDKLSPAEVKNQMELLFKKFFSSLNVDIFSVMRGKYRIRNPLKFFPLNHFIYKVSEKIKLFEDLKKKEKREREIVGLLSIVEEIKDPYTKGHSLNVANYSEIIARELGLKDKDIAVLRTAALLHDIGKISIPDWLLLKPTSLSEEEFNLVKLHSVVGEKLLSRVEGFEEVAKIVRHHHEKWDGSGYPDGLKGEEIPLFSRIIAVADVYDSLISYRPYRKALSSNEAFSIMEKMPLDKSLVEMAKRVFPQQERVSFSIALDEVEELDRYKKMYIKRNFSKGVFPEDICIFLFTFRDEEKLLSFLDRLSKMHSRYISTMPVSKTSQLVICDKETEKSIWPLLDLVGIERIV